MEVRSSLIAEAAAKMAPFPQYRGKFDSYILVRVKRRIRTKMGIAFDRGEIAIASAETRPEGPNDIICRTVWSRRNSCDTLVLERDVEVVQ